MARLDIHHRSDRDLFNAISDLRRRHGGGWRSDHSYVPDDRLPSFFDDLTALSERRAVPVSVLVDGLPRQCGQPYKSIALGQMDGAVKRDFEAMCRGEFPDASWCKPLYAFRVPEPQAQAFAARVGELAEQHGKTVTATVISGYSLVQADVGGVNRGFVEASTSVRHDIPGAGFDAFAKAHRIPAERLEEFVDKLWQLADQHRAEPRVTVDGVAVEPPPPEARAEKPKKRVPWTEPADYPDQRPAAVQPPPTTPGGTELLYRPGESSFSVTSEAIVRNGWSIFPQVNEVDKRLPAKVNGEVIKWRRLKDSLPSPAELSAWNRHAATANTALVLGPASGHTIALDIDVTNARMADDITDLAEDHLGYTPLRRVGRAPKIALIYRHTPEDAEQFRTIRAAFHARDAEGRDCKYALEVLGAGSALTISGKHHKTGRYFKWLETGVTPAFVGPATAPVIMPGQLESFLRAVDERYPFRQDIGVVLGDAPVGTIIPVSAGRRDLTADFPKNEAGLVCDGREQYLSKLAASTFGANKSRLAGMSDAEVADLRASLVASVVSEFRATAVCDDKDRWRCGNLVGETTGKIGRLIADHLRAEPAPRPAAPTRPAAIPLKAAVAGWRGNRALVAAAARQPAEHQGQLIERAAAERELAEAVGEPDRASVHRHYSRACEAAARGDAESAECLLRQVEPQERALVAQVEPPAPAPAPKPAPVPVRRFGMRR